MESITFMSTQSLTVKQKYRCTVCGGTRMERVLDLPDLPQTGIYVTDSGAEYPRADQAFEMCEECGHGQLRYVLDPAVVYGNSYTHRGGVSPIASGGNEFLASFIERVTKGRIFERAVDVGCNDLYLIRRLQGKAQHWLGVDPIWQGKDHVTADGVVVRGQFVEEANIVEDLGGRPDLIVSAHTFEHVDEAGRQIQRLYDMADDGALFVIEVPGFDSLLSSLRFDQIFHQHINHYSVASFTRLIEILGGSYVAHEFNYGFWSGTMIMAFRKEKVDRDWRLGELAHKRTAVEARQRFAIFKRQLMMARDTMQSVSEEKYGFGAAQMMPILAYHMETDFGWMRNIIDDSPQREGMNFPGMPVTIRLPRPGETFEGAAFMVTALDSYRPIMKRLIGLRPRRIVSPLNLV